MATYTSLSEEDRTILREFTNQFRGWVNDLAKQLIAARALQASYNAGGGSGSIIAALDAGQEIPNEGGLGGALPLTDDDYAALITGLNTFVATYDTASTRARMAQAAGPLSGIE